MAAEFRRSGDFAKIASNFPKAANPTVLVSGRAWVTGGACEFVATMMQRGEYQLPCWLFSLPYQSLEKEASRRLQCSTRESIGQCTLRVSHVNSSSRNCTGCEPEQGSGNLHKPSTHCSSYSHPRTGLPFQNRQLQLLSVNPGKVHQLQHSAKINHTAKHMVQGL